MVDYAAIVEIVSIVCITIVASIFVVGVCKYKRVEKYDEMLVTLKELVITVNNKRR